MKKKRQVCLVLCLIIVFQLLAVSAKAETDTNIAITKGCHTIDASVPVLGNTRMFENAVSVLAYETGTDTLMYAWNPDEPVYPASLVKIMTALIAVENANMTDVATATSAVLSTIPESAASAELKDNEVMSVQDLLYCMLTGSANDAASVLADHIGGSQESFVQMMNSRALQIGCTNTLFSDPHGLSSEQHSTARDIGRILAEALKNEQFRNVFCAAEYTVPATNRSDERNFKSGNQLQNPDSALYYDPRVIGGRTGSGLQGERCIAALSLSGDLQVVSIVIGSESVYRDDGYTVVTEGGYDETKTLLDACLSGYKSVQILYEGQALKQYKVSDGDSNLAAGPRVSVSTILPADMMDSSLNYRYNDIAGSLDAPVENGEKVSVVEIWNGPVCVAQAELFAMNRVEVESTLSVEKTESDPGGVFTKILVIIGIAVASALVVLIAIRLYNMLRMRAAQKRSRRNRRNRRRSY